MRLIDVQTLKLKEFFHGLPPYAILSHTWGGEEVTFQEYLAAMGPDPKRHAHIMQKAGFSKIVGACKRAKADGLQYLWCDTNCIDKTSSAELSEAINSMYAWYRDSVVCYAYLADVDLGAIVRVGQGLSVNPGPFQESRWFTRGWTLQELLAPKKVVFFDRMWRVFGDRKDLADHISRITRIHIGALHDRNTVPGFSIAQRMSWAADRETSRQEDIAYSLLGIFDINMPLLYGEGPKAFTRLQQEIIRCSDDQSILAWNALDSGLERRTGALAQTPSYFRFCGSIVRDPDIKKSSFTMTNVGLSMKLPMIRTSLGGLILVGLNCTYELRGRYVTDQRRQTGGHTNRRFQVYIWLWNSSHDIFERAHLLDSMVFLDRSYVVSVRLTVEDLVIVTKPSFTDQAVCFNKEPDNRHRDPFSAGFSVCFGAGKVDHLSQMYEKIHHLGKFTITHLRRKRQSSLSHQIISEGAFSTILSAAWNSQGAALKWLHTTFQDPNRYVFQKLSSKKELRSFYDEKSLVVASDNDLCAQLDKLHQDLRFLVRTVVQKPEMGLPPLVFEEDETFRDLQDQERIVVTVVFREKPLFLNSLDVARELTGSGSISVP
ncbi:HET-domain-containing protein [Xylaria longipes]|nr:HET-domain-containing protein [Xylaria longipes]